MGKSRESLKQASLFIALVQSLVIMLDNFVIENFSNMT